MTGEHEYRRVIFARSRARDSRARRSHVGGLKKTTPDVELWRRYDAEFFLTVRRATTKCGNREYKLPSPGVVARVECGGGSAGCRSPRTTWCSTFCGAGTILIERAHLGGTRWLLAANRDVRLAAARSTSARATNRSSSKTGTRRTPPRDASVNKIVTNLPWGLRYGFAGENRNFIRCGFESRTSFLKSGGAMVLLTRNGG